MRLKGTKRLLDSVWIVPSMDEVEADKKAKGQVRGKEMRKAKHKQQSWHRVWLGRPFKI